MKDDRMFAAGPVLGPVVLMMALAGCGGGDAGTSASLLTPQEEIARLEASGQLPTLERSASLGGVDENGNGVRDDIERHIQKSFAEQTQRKAAMQTARAFQAMLLVDKSDQLQLEKVSETSWRAVGCERLTFAGPDGAKRSWEMAEEIKAMTTNTKERLKAYLAYNKARSGSVSSMPSGDVCE